MHRVYRFVLLLGALLPSTPVLNAQWISTDHGPEADIVTCFASNDLYVFAGTDTSGVLRSSDNGNSWQRMSTGLPKLRVYSLFARGSEIYAGLAQDVYLSIDNGQSWQLLGRGLPKEPIASITYAWGSILAGTWTNGIYRLYGRAWTTPSPGWPTKRIIWCMLGLDSILIAGSNGAGLYVSSDNGVTWKSFAFGERNQIWALAKTPTTLLAGSPGGGVIGSTDWGNSWKKVSVGTDIYRIYVLATFGSIVFSCGPNIGSGIFCSTDGGRYWFDIRQNLFTHFVYTLAVRDTFLIASVISDTQRGSIWRRSIPEIIRVVTSVRTKSTEISAQFHLLQNFPNPFNATTTITFSIPRSGHVTLELFDILGSQAATLVDSDLDAGIHTIKWDATTFKTGVYFYHLKQGASTQVKNLLFIK